MAHLGTETERKRLAISRMVWREVCHNRVNFVLGVTAVAAAAACVVAVQAQLETDRVATTRVLDVAEAGLARAIDQRQLEVEEAGKSLQDAIRKQMLGLGFNLLIVPEEQDLAEMHLTGQMTETMPETYVDRLAGSSIVTVNHLLPTVSGRATAEANGNRVDAVVQGTRGEVPIMHRGLKKPLLEAVPPGQAVIGHEVAKKLRVGAEGQIRIGDLEYAVSKVHEERGTADDVTVWIDLAAAQEMLGLQNLVHAILALECACAGDRISVIRAEIGAILPGVKVVERYSSAVTRAEARATAKSVAEDALAQEEADGRAAIERQRDSRTRLDARRAAFYAFLTPATMVAAAFAVAVLSMLNIRDRTGEIGVLRALGWGASAILRLFVGRSFLVGCTGGVVGVLLGLVFATLASRVGTPGVALADVLLNRGVVLAVALTPPMACVFAILASWIPIFAGSRRAPAELLNP